MGGDTLTADPVATAEQIVNRGAAAFTNAYGRKTEYRCPRWDP